VRKKLRVFTGSTFFLSMQELESDEECRYIMIGRSKVFVDEQGDVSGFESLSVRDEQRASTNAEASSASENGNDSALEDYIEVMEKYPDDTESSEDKCNGKRFARYFADLDLGFTGNVEDILVDTENAQYSSDSGSSDSIDRQYLEVVSTSRVPVVQLWTNHSEFGRKKREKKKKVLQRRLEKANNRGFELQYLNEKIRNFILQEKDMEAFPPLSKFEQRQIQKLASLYGCSVTRQGSGNKKVCILHRSKRTCIPKGKEKEEIDRMLALEKHNPLNKRKNLSHSPSSTQTKINGPVKFVSTGFINPSENIREQTMDERPQNSIPPNNTVEGKNSITPSQVLMTSKTAKAMEKKRRKELRRKVIREGASNEKKSSLDMPKGSVKLTTSFGAFEKHTSGVGSKLLAKWGYENGSGLGKDGRGMQTPIQVESRPKRLGLGA